MISSEIQSSEESVQSESSSLLSCNAIEPDTKQLKEVTPISTQLEEVMQPDTSNLSTAPLDDIFTSVLESDTSWNNLAGISGVGMNGELFLQSLKSV